MRPVLKAPTLTTLNPNPLNPPTPHQVYKPTALLNKVQWLLMVVGWCLIGLGAFLLLWQLLLGGRPCCCCSRRGVPQPATLGPPPPKGAITAGSTQVADSA